MLEVYLSYFCHNVLMPGTVEDTGAVLPYSSTRSSEIMLQVEFEDVLLDAVVAEGATHQQH